MLRCAGVWRQEQGVCSKQVQQWGNARELSAHPYSTRVTFYHLLYCFSAVEQTLANRRQSAIHAMIVCSSRHRSRGL